MWRRDRKSTATLDRLDDHVSACDDDFARAASLALVDDTLQLLRRRDVFSATEVSELLLRVEHRLQDNGVPPDALAVVGRAADEVSTQTVVAAADLVDALLDIRLALA
jgi:hypothetical protein